MSLVNEALQKVRTQQARQNAANGPAPYHMPAPRGARFGLIGILVGTILLGGGVLAAWFGGIRFTHGQNEQNRQVSSVLPAPVPVVRTPVTFRITDGGNWIVTTKPQDVTLAAAEVKQPATIPPTPGTESPAPTDAAPAVVQATVPATQPAKPSIEHKAVAEVPAVVEAKPIPVALPAAPAEPVVAKEPVLVNAQTLDVPGSSKLKLMGISHSSYGSRAVINNTVVEEGDQIETATVVSIEGKRVQLKVDEKTFTLHMP